VKCPNCRTKKSLYKERNDDGTYIAGCTHCGWKTKPLPHEAKLDHIPTIQELRKDWGT
jgi:Zn ribbon nucleic-acid-binding protein